MKVLSKIIMCVLLLGIFSGCKEDEVFHVPGTSPYYYYVTIADAAGVDLLNPDNQSNVINDISLVVDGSKTSVYTEKTQVSDASKYSFITTLDNECQALAIGPYSSDYERDINIVLTIKGVSYNIKVVCRIEYLSSGGRIGRSDFYLNGELLKHRHPLIIPITI